MPTQVIHEQIEMTEYASRSRTTPRWRRDALVFLAGASAFHTLSHIWLGLSGMLPMKIEHPAMTITSNLNLFTIIANFVITAVLLYGAKRMSQR